MIDLVAHEWYSVPKVYLVVQRTYNMQKLETTHKTIEVLEQKKKFLTFEELCKEWSHYISEVGGIEKILFGQVSCKFIGSNQKTHDLTESNRCIVGEAHNGKKYWHQNLRDDYCSECDDFSMAFYGSKHSKHQVHDEKSFEDVKSQFVEHFNEVHIK